MSRAKKSQSPERKKGRREGALMILVGLTLFAIGLLLTFVWPDLILAGADSTRDEAARAFLVGTVTYLLGTGLMFVGWLFWVSAGM